MTYPIFYGPRTPGDILSDAHAQAEGTRARYAADRAREATSQLESEVARLHLVCRALWELLKDRTSVTDEDLSGMIRQIDLSDGKLDGRVRVDVVECTSCKRTLGRRHERCVYCGTPREDTGPF